MKAAFLYNFAKFVEWPTGAPRGPIKIGFLGKDPFGSTLDSTVKGKTVSGRTLVIRRLKRTQDARSCHIVFIGQSEKARLTEVTWIGKNERFRTSTFEFSMVYGRLKLPRTIAVSHSAASAQARRPGRGFRSWLGPFVRL